VDIVYWEAMEDATKAVDAAMQSPFCTSCFGMIEEASINWHTIQLKHNVTKSISYGN
jgi:hypothetical protein